MPGRFPVGKPKLPSWSLPVMALSLTLLVHALWLVIPQPAPPRRQQRPRGKLTAYPNQDARTWSPTLFSLPSALGFSGVLRERASNVRPPLQSPVRIHERSALDLAAFFPEPGLKTALPLHSRLPVTAGAGPEPGADGEPKVFAWRLQVLEGPAEGLELTRLPPLPEDRIPLMVTGSMVFDELGQIRSLELDPVELDAEQRSQVIRSLRRVRRERGMPAGRIRFQFGCRAVEERE